MVIEYNDVVKKPNAIIPYGQKHKNMHARLLTITETGPFIS